ncbi:MULTISPECIES: 3-hydroxyacyl-CoA dehydrogenase/enoyl-CoA hydratase family protein [unclassified Myroides]|uniref:3-hydroxyacyl-CoA dehydrogenase/enoyl-CoA hydratase family protein n=1 Tax=unclassified Myroides TaxID=2642485 RepID=UPI0015FCE48C|nr:MULTISPECIES: 3-hydroxyacyl-CoA dehydrogenase/enoyl-CoA hydratase family protein [unclassified Myroides]MBB1151114.1 3-hydroxyacyl-CoA dehydrogenase/enoyl-CoA hydratase family protein [Myroides sp. NP-2]MDM1408895.1 3-hydroxyacyl-CoA dehydrogenase/enoyl-CoA hydratase family protein [Myroides sp. DF42-4-2]
MKRRIKKVAVIGSGVMGSAIACHFANIGVEVLLMDIVPNALTPEEEKKGLTLNDRGIRNKIAQTHLTNALKSKPAPIYTPRFASRITVGNLEDDLSKIKEVDWIIEVVVERLDIKQSVFENIEKYRKPGTLITSNTSGIPMKLLVEGRSQDFQQHFCGTHFFNPPRYLPLFEIIPGPHTAPEVLSFFQEYARLYLGKTPVLCKDTPGFIGNRIGVYSMAMVMQLAQEIGLTIEEADTLTGSFLGRPKTGTFKLGDLVGLDTAINVTMGLKQNCPDDAMIQDIKDNKALNFLLENKFLGDKTRKGFYYKEVDKEGKTNRFALDLNTLTYRPLERAKIEVIETANQAGGTKAKWSVVLADQGKAGELMRKHFASLFAYVSQRVPEITDTLYSIDDAMRTGYAWKYGPFETWDVLGIQKGIDLVEKEGYQVAAWVKELAATGATNFYKLENGKKLFYNQQAKAYEAIPGQDAFIVLNNIRSTNKVWGNSEATLLDLGDGIVNLEFHSKMNTIGGGVLAGLNKAVEIAEQDFEGLVVGNQGSNFSVGANLMMIFMMAAEQDWDELNIAIKMFQDTMMKMRYSAIPVVAAPHGMTFGGGCELSLHADKVVAAAETYIGLVEFGVGLIPGGGGSKEMTLRASDLYRKNDVELNTLQEHFLTIGMAKVATSAEEAFDFNILQRGKDVVVVNKDLQLAQAKREALVLAQAGYTQPVKRKDIKVLGRQALGMFYVGTDSMMAGKYISEHDHKIANKLAYVMAGGDLSEATFVSEQYLLDLEREAFLSLCGERKTLERIQHMLKTGKPLRN